MKTIKYLFTAAIALMAVCSIQSCKDDEQAAADATYITIYKNDSTTMESLTLPLAASYQMIGIRSDADWKAQSDADWCTISNHEGYGYGPDSTFYLRINATKNEGARRTANITFTSGSTTKVFSVLQKGSDMDPGDPFESTYSLIENIRLGYNLGNTLDCDPDLEASSWWVPKSDLDWETVWGQPKTTQAIIDSIASKGFNVIRIPVTWFPHVDENGQVREVWMNRVKEVVDYVLTAGCYCILNVQHDSGAKNGRTDGAGWLNANPDEYDPDRFANLWTQIANAFKDYDQHLIFEAFNEILDGNDTWDDPANSQCYDVIYNYEDLFIKTVRATGGNNEYRNLVINTYSAGHTAAKLNGFRVPDDVHPNHLMASIHSYDPYNFCNDNGEWNTPMFDATGESELDEMTLLVNNRFNELGIPYIYGEFGAIDEAKDMGERVKYAKYMVTKMKAYNTTGLWWMGLYDRRKKKWYEAEIVNALFDTLGK